MLGMSRFHWALWGIWLYIGLAAGMLTLELTAARQVGNPL
jgi:hypothetical protein